MARHPRPGRAHGRGCVLLSFVLHGADRFAGGDDALLVPAEYDDGRSLLLGILFHHALLSLPSIPQLVGNTGYNMYYQI